MTFSSPFSFSACLLSVPFVVWSCWCQTCCNKGHEAVSDAPRSGKGIRNMKRECVSSEHTIEIDSTLDQAKETQALFGVARQLLGGLNQRTPGVAPMGVRTSSSSSARPSASREKSKTGASKTLLVDRRRVASGTRRGADRRVSEAKKKNGGEQGHPKQAPAERRKGIRNRRTRDELFRMPLGVLGASETKSSAPLSFGSGVRNKKKCRRRRREVML